MWLSPRQVVRFTLISCLLLFLFFFLITEHLSPATQVKAAGEVGSEQGVDHSQEITKIDNQTETLSQQNSPVQDGGCEVSASFPAKVTQWCGLITRYARERGLEPDLIAALVWQESGGNAQAYSHSGAVGLMQVMPRDGLAASFMCANGPCFASRPSIAELQDPEYNINYGTKMLAGLVRRRGNLRDALKSYGPMDVGYSYADKVMGIYERYGNGSPATR